MMLLLLVNMQISKAVQKPFLCRMLSLNQMMKMYLRDGGDLAESWMREKFCKCPYCGEEVPEASSLKLHILSSHPGKKPYGCPECKRGFERWVFLNKHMRKHYAEQPCCHVCLKIFDAPYKLKDHMASHTGEKRHECPVCKKMFYKKSNLNQHLKVHTNERAFTCNECGQAFRYAKGLKRHKLTHTSEKPYQCDECEQAFTQRQNLLRHKSLHKGGKNFVCEQCGKGFAIQLYLDRHVAIHDKDSVIYTCLHCKKTFENKARFARHTRLHTAKKVYSCDQCNETFGKRYQLEVHVSKHNVAGV
ncbi:zinc finger protein 595 isoform X2 [Anabrus simplex]|uniref:zinc finger protein 595 isoform X2 n=1 Tax=Anabrus simplex TaxID=316456 RepID=UPI0035A395B9